MQELLGAFDKPLPLHALLDTFKLLLMVAPFADFSLLEAISNFSGHHIQILKVVCMHLKEQRKLQGWMDKKKI